ncbi:hypothetical protein [Butyrivibrio sp. JL13D10]|uniref:hypothetical protein n=1 Tax=Butyrivibrio sp. JL13D10 TaxID=3236815 RepID=UPI0038B62737
MEGIIVWGIVIVGLIYRLSKLGKQNTPANNGGRAATPLKSRELEKTYKDGTDNTAKTYKNGSPAQSYKTKDNSSKYHADNSYQRISRESSSMKDREASAMPHKHREKGVYDTANRHKADNSDGTMPHSHNEAKYRSIDVATLPKGYILLNGEPVRTADLEKY